MLQNSGIGRRNNDNKTNENHLRNLDKGFDISLETKTKTKTKRKRNQLVSGASMHFPRLRAMEERGERVRLVTREYAADYR